LFPPYIVLRSKKKPQKGGIGISFSLIYIFLST
jgi:hypothetical protein